MNLNINENNLIQIYNLINKELSEAPDEEDLSEKDNEMYADMQNLKESLEEHFVDKIIEEQNKINYKERKLIGLNKYLYVFDNQKDFQNAYNILEKQGQVVEVFINNEYGFEFKKDSKILNENTTFSEESMISLNSKLSNYYGIDTTIGDENVFQIRNEMGEIGVRLYEKYYDFYKENGMSEIYDFIDSFCYGNTTEIKQYLDEIIEFYKYNKDIDKDEGIITIKEIENDKEELLKYEQQLREEEEL